MTQAVVDEIRGWREIKQAKSNEIGGAVGRQLI